MNTLILKATDDGTSMLVGNSKASVDPSGQPTTLSVAETHAIVASVLLLVVAVVVVVLLVVVVVRVVDVIAVVVVVGHRPLPGWQSGTSDCDGHGLPPADCRDIKIVRPTAFSHASVHSLNP